MATAYIVTNKSGNRVGVTEKRFKQLKGKDGYTLETVEIGESTSQKEDPEYPKSTGAGWYELSNGESVRGKEKAQKEEDNI